MAKDARELLEKYANNQCTAEEKAIVESWYLQVSRSEDDSDLSPADFDRAEERLYKRLPVFRRSYRRWLPLAAACTLLVVIGSGYYLIRQNRTRNNTAEARPAIAAGSNRAVLTLQNGRRIVLGTGADTQIAINAGLTAHKTSDGSIVFTQKPAPGRTNTGSYSTIETPQGGQYQVILSDGTKVWLNAASSLRFPDQFSGNKRQVEINGEGYFEVASNKSVPFYVSCGNQQIQVLGTHFNVHHYSDEQRSRVTLLQGSIRVRSGNNAAKLLHPGQEASSEGGELLIREVDTEDAIAWQKGYFDFTGKTVEEALREISRWYNVGIHYKDDGVRMRKIAGTISKYQTAEQVLKKIALTGIFHFEVSERIIEIE